MKYKFGNSHLSGFNLQYTIINCAYSYGEGGFWLAISEHNSIRGDEEHSIIRGTHAPCQSDGSLGPRAPEHAHSYLRPLVGNNPLRVGDEPDHSTGVITGLDGDPGLSWVNDSTPSLRTNKTNGECFELLR